MSELSAKLTVGENLCASVYNIPCPHMLSGVRGLGFPKGAALEKIPARESKTRGVENAFDSAQNVKMPKTTVCGGGFFAPGR